jgi:hypothetical protein
MYHCQNLLNSASVVENANRRKYYPVIQVQMLWYIGETAVTYWCIRISNYFVNSLLKNCDVYHIYMLRK